MSIYTSLIGVSPVTAAQIDNYVTRANPGAPKLGEYYVRFGRKFNIRADIAAGQMVHETNYLRFGGSVKPEWHNPAGLTSIKGGFQRFPSWEAGVHAHYERLNCYVRPRDETGQGGKYDDKYGHWRYFELMRRFGSADRLIDVAHLWTEGDPYAYANAVWRHAEAIAGSSVPPPPTPVRAPAWLIIFGSLLGGGVVAYILFRKALTRRE